jgi:uncharacterized protein YgiM (DUF1202 family)
MKKPTQRTLACMVVLGACLLLATALPAKTMNTLSDAVLRDSPSFNGKVVATLSRGTPIVLLHEEGGWFKVQAGEKQGWLPTSALCAKPMSLKMAATRIGTGPPDSEIDLVLGKNAPVRAKDSRRNYDAVDKMENFGMSPEECATFLRTGREGKAK